MEVSRREKQTTIMLVPDIDTYMKVPLASPICFPSLFMEYSIFLKK